VADPAAKLQHDLKGKVDQRAENAARLRTAEAKLAECRSTVEAAALGTDDVKLDAALSAKRAAEDKLAALNGAAIRISREITGIETEIAKVIDQQTRAATAREIDGLLDEWKEATRLFDIGARAIEEASRKTAPTILDANGTAAFSMNAKMELPAAVAVIVEGLRQHSANVLAGRARAALARVEPEQPKLAVVKPDTVNLFFRRHAKYIDKNGSLRLLCKFHDHEIPREIGALALKSGCAMEVSHPDRKKLSGTVPPLTPNEKWCDDLGAVDGAPQIAAPAPKTGGPPIMSSSELFTPLDRGPAITGVMAVRPV
jgi:hypothetical protein